MVKYLSSHCGTTEDKVEEVLITIHGTFRNVQKREDVILNLFWITMNF